MTGSAAKSEVYPPSAPTVEPAPQQLPLSDVECCGNCPGWNRQHAKAPFGQCLPAMKFLGVSMFTPDLSGCTLDPEIKAKGANR